MSYLFHFTKVFAEDADTDAGDLVYNVEDSTQFDFDGNVLKANAKLDAENQQYHILNISVSDGYSFAFAMVNVTVKDQNDHDPSFTNSNYYGNVSQLDTPGLTVITIEASDLDVSNRGFTYFLSSDVGFFEIYDQTGVVTVSDNTNWTPNMTYNMTVYVSDHGQPPRISTVPLSIFVDASNHYDPQFSQDIYTGHIVENSPIGTHVTFNEIINATDLDFGNAGIVRYSIKSGSDGKFDINNETGIIFVNSSIDCEVKRIYNLIIGATDMAEYPRSATATVQIEIYNENERPKFNDVTQHVCLNPPIKSNFEVVTVKATDIECGPPQGRYLTYSLLNGTENFVINNNTGEIFTTKELSSVDFVLLANVEDEKGLSANRTITLSAGNSGEPVIQPLVLNIDVDENRTVPEAITTIHATSRGIGMIFYAIKNSSLPGFFTINNKTVSFVCFSFVLVAVFKKI